MTKIEITSLFNQFNTEFFGGILPAIEIKLEKRKTARLYGQYRWMRRRNWLTGENSITSRMIRIFPIAIESGNTEETLYHEMAHYYLHHRGLPSGHTPMFKALMSKFLGKRVTNRFIQKTKQIPTPVRPYAPVLAPSGPVKVLGTYIGEYHNGEKVVSFETKAGVRIAVKLEISGWVKL